MAAVQAEDVRASFLFVSDLNSYHQEWFHGIVVVSTNRHGIVALS